MDKISKERKGVVWALMTDEERNCLIKSNNVLFFFEDGWDTANKPKYDNNTAYWSTDFDEPTGEELVGKWCILYENEEDIEQDRFYIAKCINYACDGIRYKVYYTCDSAFNHAKLFNKGERP